jgi:hypothetical protein
MCCFVVPYLPTYIVRLGPGGRSWEDGKKKSPIPAIHTVAIFEDESIKLDHGSCVQGEKGSPICGLLHLVCIYDTSHDTQRYFASSEQNST